MDIAVIIPTYDRPDKLRRAILTCLRQTHAPSQVIVVDNGVNPDTHGILEEFQPDCGERLVYARSALFQARAALAKGLELLDADWVILLDDDDLLSPDRIAKDIETIESAPEDVVMLAHDFVRADFENRFVWLHRLAPERLTLANALCLDHFGPPGSATWRSAVIRQHHPFHLAGGWTDYDLIASILQHGRACAAQRVGFIMDDTRNRLRQTTGGDDAIEMIMIHAKRFADVPSRFGFEAGPIRDRIAQQIAFQAGKNFRWRAVFSPHAAAVLRHPLEYAKGLLAPYRRRVSGFLPGLLPVMRGARMLPLDQFLLSSPELASWLQSDTNPQP